MKVLMMAVSTHKSISDNPFFPIIPLLPLVGLSILAGNLYLTFQILQKLNRMNPESQAKSSPKPKMNREDYIRTSNLSPDDF